MNTQAFLSQFQLTTPSYEHPRAPRKNSIASAVLIPLMDIQGKLHVTLTRRALHLRKHAGQISFPGGKIEKQDSSIEATALRESYEEIGLAPNQVKLIGRLPDYFTQTGFQISPIIGLIPSDITFKLDQGEVADIYQIPVAYFTDKKAYKDINISYRGKPRRLTFIPYQDRLIWGATAAMLKSLFYKD